MSRTLSTGRGSRGCVEGGIGSVRAKPCKAHNSLRSARGAQESKRAAEELHSHYPMFASDSASAARTVSSSAEVVSLYAYFSARPPGIKNMSTNQIMESA